MFRQSRRYPKIPNLLEDDLSQTENIYIAPELSLKNNKNIFETDQSSILKYALDVNIPSKYIFKLNDEIISLLDYIKYNIIEDYLTIYDFVVNYIPIEKRDVAFFLYQLQGDNEDLISILPEINIQYKNLDFFKKQFEDWKETNIILLKSDSSNFEEINKYLQAISQTDPLISSIIHITKYNLQFKVNSKSIRYSEISLYELGQDIFANSIASNLIPYIRFNNSDFSRFKIFTGETFEQRPQFKLFESKTFKFKNKNTIYFILLSSKSNNKQVRESYSYASIDLMNRTLNLKFFPDTSKNINEIMNTIKYSFPDLDFSNPSEKSFNGFFKIFNVVAREDSFLDMITNSFFNNFLFLDESEVSAADTKKSRFYFDTKFAFSQSLVEEPLSSISTLSSYIHQYFSGVNDSSVSSGKFEIVNFKENTKVEDKVIGGTTSFIEKQFLPNKTPYIIVYINKAKNRYSMYQYANFMSRLMNIYDSERKTIENEYMSIVSNLKENGDKLIMYSSFEKDVQQKGKIPLQVLSPEIFSGDYSRDCGFQNQPIIIDPAQKEFWESKKIKDKDTKKIIDRPTLDYGGLTFVCPGDNYPFVGLKQKKTVIDENFQFYPCCYSKPQKEIKQRLIGKTKRTSEPIKTKKIVGEEGLGFLPSTTITDYLYGIFNSEDPIYRMGSFFSTSSVLSSLLLAQNNKYYLSLNDNQKSIYLLDLRKSIANQSDFNLTSSELFDMKLEDRIKLFLDSEEFLDPSLFYRILENAFNLNIFIISGTKPEPNLEAKYSFDTSRFSSIPMHSYQKSRKNVILFKHWGSESDNLPHPHVELIVVGEDQKSLFDDSIGDYLLQGYYLTSQLHGRSHIISSQFQLYDYNNIIDIIKSSFLENLNIVSQILDNKGKCRALRILIKNIYVTIFITPIPPLNYPISNIIDIHDYKIIRDLFSNEPFAYSKETSSKVNGLWYSLFSLNYGIFIPIKSLDISYFKTLLQGPDFPISMKSSENKTERLIKLTKDIKLLNQIIRFLFNIYRLNVNFSDKNKLITDFFNRHVLLKQSSEQDSSLFYNFSRLPRILPYQSKNIVDAMSYFKQYVPELIFSIDKMIIYSKKLYDRLYQSIEFYISKDLDILIPHFLSEYYITENDYSTKLGNIIFFNEENVNNWVKRTISDSKSIFEVHTKINKILSSTRVPFLYSPFPNTLCLIQNSSINVSIQRSLNICHNWQKNGINDLPDNLINIEKGYKIFTVSKEENLELMTTVANEDEQNFLYILKYPDINQYASILPL
jgi:hypothetical protein